MGWTSLHREPGMSDRSFFEGEFPLMLGEHGRILDCATAGSVFYAVVANNELAAYAPGSTWMLVVLVRRTGGFYNFSYKEMSEADGPCEARCPRRLLELLESRSPEAPNEWAAEWRNRCWENVHKTERAARFVKRGTVVYFSHPVSFTSGLTVSELVFVERSTFRTVGGYGRYRVPGWRLMDWSLEPVVA